MERLMINHDCLAEMDVWKPSPDGPSGYLFWAENDSCAENHDLRLWRATGATLTAFYRCDLGENFGKYELTIYRDIDNGFGGTSCQYVVLPKIRDVGLGQNFEIL